MEKNKKIKSNKKVDSKATPVIVKDDVIPEATKDPISPKNSEASETSKTKGSIADNAKCVIPVIAENEKPTFETKKIDGVNFIDISANPERYTLNDLGMGYLFADTFYDCLRYVSDANNWFYYNGCIWKEDIGGVFSRQCAKALIEYLKKTISDEKFIDEISRWKKRETIIKEAKDVHPVTLNDFDTNPYLFNCKNCTIDLRTGQTREHDSADFLRKVAHVEYDPNAKCDRWERFIDEVMCGDVGLKGYLQKIKGYGLSGDISQECLFILYGPTTRNGKGTLMESIGNILGDYSRTIQPDSLSQRKGSSSGHSADIARLAGIRFVNASELPDDLKLNAALVKQLTGGDTITTRFLYQNFFEYRPQFKIYINTNHLPEIGDDTLFSSGRLKLIPFDRHFADSEQERGLKSYFQEDSNKSAILNWLLDGYKLYKAEGLIPPSKAEDLLREYRQNSDSVGLYINNCLVSCDEKQRSKTSEFYSDFLNWCQNKDVARISLKEFVHILRQKNLLARDREIGNYIKGYRINDNE